MSDGNKKLTENLPKKVLIVEDIPEVMLIMVAVVYELGHNAHPALDGHEAIELIGKGLRPDLILLDLRLPRMNGLQFYNNTRAIPDILNTPIILTSSDVLAADLVIALNLFGHAHKTTSRDNLRAMIKSALRISPKA